MCHNKSGQTNKVSFHIDDCQNKPVFVGSISVSFGTCNQYISGIRTYAAGNSITINGTVSSVISSYFNSQYGLARLESSICQSVNEKDVVGRDVSNYLPGSTQYVDISSNVIASVYEEQVEVVVSAFNSQGSVTTTTVTTPARVDTVSQWILSQVQSGITKFPSKENQDFGSQYDHNVSLMDVPELQLLNGMFQIPTCINYTINLPNGSPDYTGSNRKFTWRWATFKLPIQQCMSNLCLYINGLAGEWGDSEADKRGDYTICIRCVNERYDSGWLDTLKYYDGNPLKGVDGEGCLLRHRHNVRQVTLGTSFKGNMYVRIGFEAMQCTYTKSFASVSFDASMELARYLPQIPITFDNFFFDGISARDGKHVGKILTQPFRIKPLLNFVAANTGYLAVEIGQSGSLSMNYGRISLPDVPIQGQATDSGLTVYNKHPLQLDNEIYVASVSLDVFPPLSSSNEMITINLIHSEIGSTTCDFYLDQPSLTLPSIGSLSISVSDPAPNCFSGIKAHAEYASITVTCQLMNCVSYFYDPKVIKLCGDYFDQTQVSLLGLSAYGTLTGVISATCKGMRYQENAVAIVVCSNIARQKTASQISFSSPLRIDTVSRVKTSQVTSGNGIFPIKALQDFGLPYDHSVSLLLNQELQLVGGQYRIPLAIDFSQSSPPSFDYRKVNQGLEWRYSTFHYVINKCFSNGLVSVLDPQNWDLWQEQCDIQVHIRIIDHNGGDTSWLDVFKPYKGGIPRQNGDGCAIANQDGYRAVSFIHCYLQSDVFLRIGIKCTSQDKSFAGIRFYPIKCFSRWQDSQICLASSTQIYECILVGTKTHLPCWVVPQSEVITFEPMYFRLRTDSIVNVCLNGVPFSLSPTDCLEGNDVAVGPLYMEHVKIMDGKESDIVLQVVAEPNGLEDCRISCRIDGETVFDYKFYVLEANVPFFNNTPTLTITQYATRFSSGVRYYASGDIVVSGSASGVVSRFVSASKWVSLESPNLQYVIDCGDNIESTNSIQAFEITSSFRGYAIGLNAIVTIYSPIRQTAQSIMTLPYLIDTISRPSDNRVTSGADQFPVLQTFGFGIDEQQSLNDNSELMFSNDIYKIPDAVDYSQYQPSGSPNYLQVNEGRQMRYATFKYETSCMCDAISIEIEGQEGSGWGDNQQVATSLSLQMRLVGTLDSGWLDCNAFYNGFGVPFGDGCACLLSVGTSTTRKRITLGGMQYDGVIFVRLGIDCQNTMSKGFSKIGLSINTTLVS